MLSEKYIKAINLILFSGAIIINFLSLLFLFLPKGAFSDILFSIGLTRWGWLPAFIFLNASLIITILWKPYNKIMRGIIIGISMLILIYDVIWFSGIFFISHLHF